MFIRIIKLLSFLGSKFKGCACCLEIIALSFVYLKTKQASFYLFISFSPSSEKII